MKKGLIFGIAVMMAVSLSACFKQELADMATSAGEKYTVILWDERTYVPYCAISKSDRGEQIGVVNGDKNDRVYEYKGYPADQWLINGYSTHLMDTFMLL